VTFEEACAHALSLDGAERASHYGAPAIKVNGRAILNPGREPGSFCLHVDEATKLILIETDPNTFWQTPHYDGYPAVLVRETSDDPKRVKAMIEAARDWAASRKPPRPRKSPPLPKPRA
jgi:hypothetical protein